MSTMFRSFTRFANWSSGFKSFRSPTSPWTISTMTASVAAAALVSTSCPTPIVIDEPKKVSSNPNTKRYEQKRPERKLKSVVEPGIEPYHPKSSFTHNHAENELLEKIWDEDNYAADFPVIALDEVRKHY